MNICTARYNNCGIHRHNDTNTHNNLLLYLSKIKSPGDSYSLTTDIRLSRGKIHKNEVTAIAIPETHLIAVNPFVPASFGTPTIVYPEKLDANVVNNKMKKPKFFAPKKCAICDTLATSSELFNLFLRF